MGWYKANAPIRLKLLIAFGSFVALVALSGSASLLVGESAGRWVALAVTVLALGLAVVWREAIAGPYVTTVVRMEGLAAGDLDSPIEFTEYRDCVGRLTQAMFQFRATAQAEIAANEESRRAALIVQGMAENFRSLAEGDLTADIVEDYPAEYAALKVSFNEALASLRSLLGSVKASTQNSLTGSREIAQASEDLARRTEGNAASLEQTAAAIQQIDERLKATAQAATRSVTTSEQAMGAVLEGRARTDAAVQAMNRVSDSAKGIDGVIEGLDKIAFQTRVLAMNAAVEAGRAGDAGRGFAVVADLVSALAMRAEEESKRARDQLGVTQTDIEAAMEAVHKVDSAFGVISSSGEEVTRLAGQIAADNDAQAAAIGEINTAVGAMDHATQQNAAMVEETSAAARNLSSEIAALAAEADRFRMGPPMPGLRLISRQG
ncbi:MAG: chemotaxis protein [Novosphingobium pentaromativorans]|uniref:Chemotaxis protein n=1 Tax=Novosphingobium pentaromativorans TaxID=205844 RepID=A0A2W5NUP6_9SPHN|nr:MAG: chemotaxis protein [Novosphingobium pentaromativorans]